MVAATRRYQARLNRIATTAGRAVIRAWDELTSYDEDDIPTFIRRTTVPFTAARAAATSTAAGYFSLLTTVRPPAIDPAELGVVPAVRDPFIAYWQALKAHPWEEAVEIGRNRADAVASDLVTSTSRRTVGEAAQATGQEVVGWRRVLTGISCTWCATVSTQRYRTAESADFGHQRCDCTVAPIIGDADPGRVINRPVLQQLRKRGTKYWDDGYVNPDGTPALRADATPDTGT
jgi:hypothetical protein